VKQDPSPSPSSRWGLGAGRHSTGHISARGDRFPFFLNSSLFAWKNKDKRSVLSFFPPAIRKGRPVHFFPSSPLTTWNSEISGRNRSSTTGSSSLLLSSRVMRMKHPFSAGGRVG